MFGLLGAKALQYMEDHRQRAVLRRMLDHDDRMLRDIGLERSAIHEALDLPMGAGVRKRAVTLSEQSLGIGRAV
ncbi:MAG: DUF1127 domain-containing protein [Pseudomonadota bacterium]